jgi:hypothetical protein
MKFAIASKEIFTNNMDRDLEQDIWNDSEILNKIRTRDDYAQNIYAAFCNMRWCPREFFPALRQDPKQDLWSCSWRSAGGLVADWQGKGGDYMDWYCSGMGGLNQEYGDKETNEDWQKRTKFVPEGVITGEVEKDLNRLGWFPVPWGDDEI